MKTTATFKVPDKLIAPIITRLQIEFDKTVENFNDYEVERIKQDCGPAYAHIPLCDFRRYGGNLRKLGLVGRVKGGHGPSVRKPPSKEYQEYLKTDHWQEIARRCKEFWGHRCALCYSDAVLDCHHRTYDRLGEELPTDIVALCRRCHKQADIRRKWQSEENVIQPGLYDD